MKIFTLLLFSYCFFCSMLFSLTFKDKLENGEVGDFIIFQQDSNYSLLSLRSFDGERLMLEEITVPTNQIKLPFSWYEWVEAKAPGNTSWIMYEIDMKENQLIEGYSFTKKGWLYFDETEQLLSKLLILPLTPIPNDLKRRIGPPPLGEGDHRPFWNPSLIFNGKKQNKPNFDTLQTKWPKDGTLLGGHRIEFYFDKDHPFPFPYWVQVAHNHFGFKMRAIDSGKAIASPQPLLPHRPPEFLGKLQKNGDDYQLFLKSPSYYKAFHLYAIDLTEPTRTTLPVPIKEQKKGDGELVVLELSNDDLSKIFTVDHHYQWIIVPENETKIAVESNDFFVWR